MGRIKSALEIALERTESVKGDKTSIDLFEAKQRGKKLANDFLTGDIKSLEEEIKKAPKEQKKSLRQGIFDVLLSQITLPTTLEDEKRIEAVGKGLQEIIGNSRFNALYKQFTQGIAQYLNEAQKFDELIRRQYAPKLRQKEEELSRRLGRTVQIDPFQDPEFVVFYNQNMTNLRDTYQQMADQVQEQTRQLFKA